MVSNGVLFCFLKEVGSETQQLEVIRPFPLTKNESQELDYLMKVLQIVLNPSSLLFFLDILSN